MITDATAREGANEGSRTPRAEEGNLLNRVGINGPELLVLAVIAVIVLGPERLPE